MAVLKMLIVEKMAGIWFEGQGGPKGTNAAGLGRRSYWYLTGRRVLQT